MSGQHVKTEPLTADEIRALQLVANGLTEAAAARTFGKPQRSYRRVMASARTKLGAVNVTHAVYLATVAGLIGPER